MMVAAALLVDLMAGSADAQPSKPNISPPRTKPSTHILVAGRVKIPTL
jgi:hypothetical protein